MLFKQTGPPLKPIQAKDVIANIHATTWPLLLSALGATGLGYLALIGYDWSALRYLGKKVPLRIVALGGFLSYGYGNTIGISILSGGAVRYRIYTAFGLSAFEVATVSTFVALAFGFGITVVGLGALALHPYALEGVLPFTPPIIRLWATIGVLALVGCLPGCLLATKPCILANSSYPPPTPAFLAGN